MDELNPCNCHELKCWPEYFKAVESGDKPFEVRKFDRPYAVGGTLILREYDPKIRDYTGREIQREISYLLDLTYLPDGERPIYGGYVVLGLRYQTMENKPLTLDQLRQMDGDPVWIQRGKKGTYRVVKDVSYGGIYGGEVRFTDSGPTGLRVEDYCKTWVPYAHKPEQEDDHD